MQIAMVDVGTLARNWCAVALRGVAGIVFGIFTFVAPGISLVVLVLMFAAYALADGILAIASAIRGGGDRWWVLLLEGIMGIGTAAVTLFWPGITALALLYMIAAWAFVTGGLEIAAAIRLRKVITGEWLLVLSGIASIALGTILVLSPAAGALALVLWIGAYALVSGALLVTLGFRLRAWGRSLPGAHAPHTARAYA